MTDRDLWRPSRAIVILIATLAVVAGVPAPNAAAERSIETPATTVPSTPDTTQPDTTEPDATEPAEMVSDDDSSVTAVTVVAVLAFVLLLGLAAWWMVSRNDQDDAEYPQPLDPDEPLPGQDLL